MKSSKTVDEFFENEKRWKDELIELREIINQTELVETIKWGAPVYTINGKNVVGMGAFKSYFGMWFFQGVFLKDKAKKLINAGEGRTKALRQWRLNSKDEIDKKLILQYLEEAIENQKRGKEIKPERKKKLEIPSELTDKFKEYPKVKKAFEEFTPGKQREFVEYIVAAKREDTKQKRLEKIVPLILENVGLNDRYKSK
jgi:uncharacterized protein YdeI (YjbR/CyaY-like superfamily)